MKEKMAGIFLLNLLLLSGCINVSVDSQCAENPSPSSTRSKNVGGQPSVTPLDLPDGPTGPPDGGNVSQAITDPSPKTQIVQSSLPRGNSIGACSDKAALKDVTCKTTLKGVTCEQKEVTCEYFGS